MDYTAGRRRGINIVLIFILMYTNQFFIGPYPKFFLNILVWGTYSVILLIPKSKWTKGRLFAAVLVVLLETGFGLFYFHEKSLIYFLAIVVVSITMQLSLSKSRIPVMAAVFVAAILYLRFGSDTLFSIMSFILFTIILYFYIRTRMQRNEMIELDKLHLAELQEAYDQLQEASATTMQYAVLEERTRIAREIHDAVGHSLTSLIVQMQALRYMIKKDPLQSEQSLEEMLAVARQGLQDIRTSVHALAEDQSKSGIIPMKALLSRMEASASIHYEFHTNVNEEDLDVNINGVLFKVLQEAITNVIRHAHADFVHVSLEKEPGKIVMRFRDNGIMDARQKFQEGFGLKAMKTRLEERGGRLTSAILEPNGFEITAEIPLAEQTYNEANGG